MNMLIREALQDDLEQIVEIDTQVSGVTKPRYWRDVFEGYQQPGVVQYFLVAECDGQVVGFIMGEIKAWEFGSPLCGWVIAIGVKPDDRLSGVGTRMLDTLCANFRQAGVTKIRTMVERQNHELLSFFRSQGMMAGPYLQLEKELD